MVPLPSHPPPHKSSNEVSFPVRPAPCPCPSLSGSSHPPSALLSHNNPWSPNMVWPPRLCSQRRGKFWPRNCWMCSFQGFLRFHAGIVGQGFRSEACSSRCGSCSWDLLLFTSLEWFRFNLGLGATFSLNWNLPLESQGSSAWWAGPCLKSNEGCFGARQHCSRQAGTRSLNWCLVTKGNRPNGLLIEIYC